MAVQSFDTDLFVIGGGSGGVRAARMAAQRGARVMMAEAGGTSGLGGTCVNVGCIPKKLYSYAAHYAESFEESHGFGWNSACPKLDWGKLKNNRRIEISRLNGVYQKMLLAAGVQIINAHARLVDANTVETTNSADGQITTTRIRAKDILIATGGRPHVPNFPGSELVLTSNEIFDIDPFPARLLVVGGGYIACEFASIFNGLGAKVTQLYRGEQVLRGFDDDVRSFLATESIKKGVDLQLKSDVASIRHTSEGLLVQLQSGNELRVDAVLYATGRLPNVASLGLQQAGVIQAGDGAVVVDDVYRSNISSIYAVGDVTSRVQLTPVALAEAMVVVDHLYGPAAGKAPKRLSYEFIPTAVFTHPSIGTIGFSEAEARKEFAAISIYRSEFRALKHTLSGSGERTLMKLIVDNATDRVVGLHMVGADAGETVQGFAVALKAGATKAIFDNTIGIHPTAAEEFVTMREPVPNS
jgi:glutathione reductase (NADPH)